MVEIYFSNIKSELSKKQYAYFKTCISNDLREKLHRFHFEEDRLRSLYGNIMVRNLACKKLGMKNYEITFSYSEYGKPYIEETPEFHFNISHSHDWVICAVSSSQIGVDIEKVQLVDMDIAERFFSEEEYQDLLYMPKEEQMPYFYRLWCSKESYIKYTGKGLSMPLNSFHFWFDDKNQIHYENIPESLYFKHYETLQEFPIVVCSKEDNRCIEPMYFDIRGVSLTTNQ